MIGGGQFLFDILQSSGQIARIDITAQQPVFEPAPLEFGSLRFEQPHAVDNVIELLFDILRCCGRGSLAIFGLKVGGTRQDGASPR